MDKATWNSILFVAVLLILGASLYSVVVTRPRGQVLLPFLPTLAASIAIYNHGEGGSPRSPGPCSASSLRSSCSLGFSRSRAGVTPNVWADAYPSAPKEHRNLASAETITFGTRY
jgi:hypothetical protein